MRNGHSVSRLIITIYPTSISDDYSLATGDLPPLLLLLRLLLLLLLLLLGTCSI